MRAQAELGLSAFMGKMGVSDADKVKAVTLLAEKGMAESVRVAPLRKLPDETRVRVVLALSVFAFWITPAALRVRLRVIAALALDLLRPKYSRIKFTPLSPAKELVKASIRFGVEGFRPSEYEVRRELREVVRVKCKACNGKARYRRPAVIALEEVLQLIRRSQQSRGSGQRNLQAMLRPWL